MNEEHSYFPDPCLLPGHVPGCAGRAGGEHELLVTPQPIPDDARLEIGKLVFDRFLSGSPENGDREDATAWLRAIGFGGVEWVQGDQDDVLLLLLWRFGSALILDEFIIEFSGHDAANIALFNLVKEVSL